MGLAFRIACAAGATALGCLGLWLAGAPTAYVIVNAAAFVGAAIVVVAGMAAASVSPGGGHSFLVAVLGAAMLAVAVVGDSIDGVARWVSLGGFRIQPTLIAAPVMLVLYSQHKDRVGLAGMALLSLALALQSDRGLSAALAAGLAAMVLTRRDHAGVAALAAASLALGVAVLKPDSLAPVRHVELVLVQSFEASILAGLAAWASVALLIAPGMAGWRSAPHAAFTAMWTAILVAATLGLLPTPAAGYGASAIIGYLLSLACLPRPKAERVA